MSISNFKNQDKHRFLSFKILTNKRLENIKRYE